MAEKKTFEAPIVYQPLSFDTEVPPLSSEGPGCPPTPRWSKFTSPRQWSRTRKNFCTGLSCMATMLATYTPGAYTAGAAQYQAEWGIDLTTVYAGVTTFTICFAISPMILAPFSELKGRRPVFLAAGLVFFASQLGAAFSTSFAGMLVSRVTAGISCSVFSAMVAGVLSDIYAPSERNTPMAIFSGCALCSSGVGPMVSGIIAQHCSWRWIYYVQSITSGMVVLAMIFFFKETRDSVLLSAKATALNEWFDAREAAGFPGLEELDASSQICRVRYFVDNETGNIATLIKISLLRPLHLLFTESVVFFFSLWMAFAWAILYMTFEAIPLIFADSYGFDSEQNGLVYLSISVSAALFTPIAIYQEKYARRGNHISETAEGRLYFACFQSALLPIGLFWFGWTSFSWIPWIVPTLAIACVTMGIFSVYLAVFNYLADTYHRYASSAQAAQSFTRNVFAAVIPLFSVPMLNGMTFQGALSFLGGLGIILTFIPWVLAFYGPRIRARSKIACELVEK